MSSNIHTLCVHGGEQENKSSAVSAPIYQSATFSFDTPEDIGDAIKQPFHPLFYGRYATPNTLQAASAIAQLEGAEAGIVVASGMAAISLVFFTFLKAGDHVVAQRSHYPTTSKMLTTILKDLNITVTLVDQVKNDEFARAIQPNTKVLYVETPCNPTLSITDLKFTALLGKKHPGIVTVCDNTFATPFNQRPLEFGIDLVVHSATKYLGGHSDVVAGALVGSKVLIERT
jgi:cystathionine beta-lyase/cystathionine gamma-synthase